MASWMTHLRIAGELLERIPNLDAAQFGIGNIAPDAGVPDENWKHFDPPPNVTHYSSGKNHRGRYIRDLDYYRQFDDALAPGSPDARQRAFLLGYFFHLLTDRLFDAYIWSLPGPDIRSLSEVDRKQLIKTIREEWQSIDQIYVRDHPEAFFGRSSWMPFTLVIICPSCPPPRSKHGLSCCRISISVRKPGRKRCTP